MKLLITGGCGFLGSNLAGYALGAGMDLCIFDNLSREGSSANLAWLQNMGQFNFIHGDIRNAHDVDRAIKRFEPDAVFHLAGQVAMTTSIANPRTDFEVNALGTLNVLEAVRQYAKHAMLLYSSTNKVYGDLERYSYREDQTRYLCTDYPNGFDENVPLDFSSPYGCSKGSADQYFLDYNRVYGLNTVVFRHSSMYGGRQFSTADQGWVGWFCQMAVNASRGGEQHEFTISGNGKQVRDVLHADDMIRLYFSVLAKGDSVAGTAFNVGGGIENSLSLLELFDLLESLTGASMAYRHLPPRVSDQRVFVADISKISLACDWRPKTSAAIGVKEMLNWIELL